MASRLTPYAQTRTRRPQAEEIKFLLFVVLRILYISCAQYLPRRRPRMPLPGGRLGIEPYPWSPFRTVRLYGSYNLLLNARRLFHHNGMLPVSISFPYIRPFP